mmetsp:Transcript_10488/g.42326  ORF Transcript_10488/g.42326 Transcript_10488/m.42326 type:complete len:242 (+) Transcript_10488:1756-2481(+)
MARSAKFLISGASTPTRRMAASLTSSILAWASASARAWSAASSLVNSPLRTPLTNRRHLRQQTTVWENVAKSIGFVSSSAFSSVSPSPSSIWSPSGPNTSGPNRSRLRSCASFCRRASRRARSLLRTAYSSASVNPHSSSHLRRRSAAALARRISRTFFSSRRLSSASLAALSLLASASARALRVATSASAQCFQCFHATTTSGSRATGLPNAKNFQAFHATTAHSCSASALIRWGEWRRM